MFKKLKNKKGFTLTELIVVIVIIGILAAVLIPTLTGYITKANKSVDEQKVASLNTLLIEAQVNEKKFNDALELKEYLEDEMDYDGDYSLKVEGSYMWYDTLKRKIVIIDEDDDKMLSTATVVLKPLSGEKTFKFVTDGDDLRSPEGLMQYDTIEKDEVWLIGGNGYLFDLVEEIRNIGNSGTSSTLSEYKELPEGDIKIIFEKFFEKAIFSNGNNKFYVKNGEIKIFSGNDSEKIIVEASQDNSQVVNFHNKLIRPSVKAKANELKDYCTFEIEEYNKNIVITIVSKENFGSAAPIIQDIIKIINKNGCQTGYIISASINDPKDNCASEIFVNDETEYETHLKNIINCYNNNNSCDGYTIDESLINVLKTLKGEGELSLSDLEIYYKVDLDELVKKVDAQLIANFLDVALNLRLSDNKYSCNLAALTGEYDYNFFKEKNPIKLIGNIDSKEYGKFDIEYTFEFKIADSIKNEQTQQ